MQNNLDHILFRKPSKADAFAIWQLIKRSPPLDLNSLYAYLVLCCHFADTSIVAASKAGIDGYISGYLEPAKDDTLFIWQVVVKKERQKQGLAKSMLLSLLNRSDLSQVHYLETTVNPSNAASRSLFYSLADLLNTDCRESTFFSGPDFGDQVHEEEILYRIGPFDISLMEDK